MPKGSDFSRGFVDAGSIGKRVFLGDLAVQDDSAAGRG